MSRKRLDWLHHICLCCTWVLTPNKSPFAKGSHDNNILCPLPWEMLSRHTPLVVLRKCCNSVIYHCEVCVCEEKWMDVCVCHCWLSSGYPWVCCAAYTHVHCTSWEHTFILSFNVNVSPSCSDLSQWMTAPLHQAFCCEPVDSLCPTACAHCGQAFMYTFSVAIKLHRTWVNRLNAAYCVLRFTPVIITQSQWPEAYVQNIVILQSIKVDLRLFFSVISKHHHFAILSS